MLPTKRGDVGEQIVGHRDAAAAQMADGAMRLWERLGDLGLDEAKRVQPLLEALLYELGRQIAASLSGPPPDGQGRPRNPKAH